jgi:hypothetical protein
MPLKLLMAVAALTSMAAAQDSRPTAPDAARTTEIRALYSQGLRAYESGDHAKAIELYRAAIDKGMKSPEAPYNMACCQALLGQTNDAFQSLAQAIERGWRSVDHMKADADLTSLRGDSRWAAALASCEAAREKYFRSLKEPELARELLKRRDEDQRLRFQLEDAMRKGGNARESVPQNLMHELDRVDRDNTEFMKKAIEKHGWPGRSLVGDDASRAAWLLIQHSPDTDLQSRCADLLRTAVKNNDANGQDLAYLTDRVLIRQGKKQVYGTQFRGNGKEAQPFPIEDEANVDKRRAEIGLQPLAEYAKTIRGE